MKCSFSKKVAMSIIVVLISANIASASYDDDAQSYKVRIENGEKIGVLLKSNGHWVIPPQFDNSISIKFFRGYSYC